MGPEIIELSAEELAEIREHGIQDVSAKRQFLLLKKGNKEVQLDRPARINDGILQLSEEEKNKLSQYYSNNFSGLNIVKFIPASGAASRMFADLSNFYENNISNDNIDLFFDNISKFAFYPLVKSVWEKNNSKKETIRYLLEEEGLGYASKPKGFFPFHFENGQIITPLESHIREAVYYSFLSDGEVALHFTFSEEHVPEAGELIKEITNHLYSEYGITFSISISVQSNETDTISLDESGRLLRDDQGKIVFRPGGHGSLLKNIAELDADLIFIRNIDNILPPSANQETIRYKKVLGGLILKLRKFQYDLLNRLEGGDPSAVPEAKDFIGKYFFQDTSRMTRNDLFLFLKKPLRVCGMVLNSGEPGGGPFWVKEENGQSSLQIIESSQVSAVPQQQEILRSSTHFNPVDLVCSLKDHKGQKFDLFDYVNYDSSIITTKNFSGKKIKIIEHPGLWNGSMAGWLTVFIELPQSVFNPVKSVTDLLKTT